MRRRSALRKGRSDAELAEERATFVAFIKHGDWGDMGSFLFDELQRTRQIRRTMQRTLRRIARAMAAAALFLAVLGAYDAHQQSVNHKTQQQLESSSHSQLVNRAANVESWCGGINETRDYDRRFVHRVTGGRVVYALGDLSCEALIRKTLESPKHKQGLTPASNPLTYRVLRELRGHR